jgi:glycolate oxidase iron-sulfur subunit
VTETSGSPRIAQPQLDPRRFMTELATERHQHMLDECIHCGLCLLACPTYRVLRVEPDSPRGRLHLMKASATGQVDITDKLIGHMGLCLQCRACETACPATVQFGHLMEVTRDAIRQRRSAPLHERLLRRLVFRELLPHPRRLALIGQLMRLYQATGLRRLVGASGLLGRVATRPGRIGKIAGRLAAAEKLMPAISSSPYEPRAEVLPGFGSRRYRVAVLLGCIQNVAFADVNAATVRVLRHMGCDVVIPPAQTCCGALHSHSGEREQAKALARRNLDAFRVMGALGGGTDAILINAAGCGAALKDYGELLHDDPVYGDLARTFAERVRDVSEWLASHLGDLRFRELPVKVVYQDACHLAHGQGIRKQPRDILRAIPGLSLVEMRDSDHCCGSAGIYNLLHPEMATQLQEEKVRNLLATGASIVISGNPGCLIQMQAGLAARGAGVESLHIMSLVDRALDTGV